MSTASGDGPETARERLRRRALLVAACLGAVISFVFAGAATTQDSLPNSPGNRAILDGAIVAGFVVGVLYLRMIAILGRIPKPPRIVRVPAPPTPPPPPKVITKIEYRTKPPEREETEVYRLWNSKGELLYVGIGVNALARWRDHAVEKPWWKQVARTDVRRYPYRYQALAVEHAAIIFEKPRYNIAPGALQDPFCDHFGWREPIHLKSMRVPPARRRR